MLDWPLRDCYAQDLPHWNYDGSSTGQAPGHDSEVYLVPRAIYKDPFRGGDNILVMCDTYEPPRPQPDGSVIPIKPIPTNTRFACAEVMKRAEAEEPWFGIEQVRNVCWLLLRGQMHWRCSAQGLQSLPVFPCAVLALRASLPECWTAWLLLALYAVLSAQEYTLLNAVTKWPLGWPKGGYPAPQGPYYCSAGAGVSIGRDIPEVHYRCCLYAGINISGINGEVLPSQWEYQVRVCHCIASACARTWG